MSAVFALPCGEGRVEVAVWSRAYPGGLGIFDDNWLNAEVTARLGSAGHWRYPAFLRAGDLAGFAAALGALCAGTAAVAALRPRDPWIRCALRADGAGSARGALRLRDGGSERGAAVDLVLAAAALRRLTAELRAVSMAFPERP